MTLDDLKALENSGTPVDPDFPSLWMTNVTGPDGDIEKPEDVMFLGAMKRLAPHLIALWETCMSDNFTVGDGYEGLEGVDNAINTLNAELSKI